VKVVPVLLEVIHSMTTVNNFSKNSTLKHLSSGQNLNLESWIL